MFGLFFFMFALLFVIFRCWFMLLFVVALCYFSLVYVAFCCFSLLIITYRYLFYCFLLLIFIAFNCFSLLQVYEYFIRIISTPAFSSILPFLISFSIFTQSLSAFISTFLENPPLSCLKIFPTING